MRPVMKLTKLILAGFFALVAGLAHAQQSVFVPATTASVLVNGTQAITQFAPAVVGKSNYLTQISLRALTTSVVTLSYGTGTNCGTGTTTIMAFTAGAAAENIFVGTGYGAMYVVPQGNAVCLTVGTAAASGWISWAQF